MACQTRNVILTLRFVVGVEVPTDLERRSVDVFPADVVDGLATPTLAEDPVLDIFDVIMVLRGAVGLITFAPPA